MGLSVQCGVGGARLVRGDAGVIAAVLLALQRVAVVVAALVAGPADDRAVAPPVVHELDVIVPALGVEALVVDADGLVQLRDGEHGAGEGCCLVVGDGADGDGVVLVGEVQHFAGEGDGVGGHDSSRACGWVVGSGGVAPASSRRASAWRMVSPNSRHRRT
ncbi:hypothetical protein UN64_19530 [Fictibacillus arsenicus]|uniref:Uncharacterized protein n=1 Tax=Fictibacillus arsenicus TaxID=255247 RepID=A0A1V3FZJ4_9BACL|nr:hypothetical protein UN64_19530 [Fictibacillus arsenicus]